MALAYLTTTAALVYRATEENEEYLGERPLPDIAQQIFESVGPSGANKEYLYQLRIWATRQINSYEMFFFFLFYDTIIPSY